MAIWTIIRVDEVPAKSQVEATDRMLQALVLGVEHDYHVKDIIREPGAKPGTGWADPIWQPDEYQTFLKALGYRKDKPGMFAKLLR